MDFVIDSYIHFISRLGEQIEDIDDELIRSNPLTEVLEKINDYKAEINYFRKSIKPCHELILNFAKLDSEFIAESLDVHLHSLQKNIELANDSVDSYREILSDQLNIYHTNVTFKLNDILKFLTIFSVILIPITFIADIYGTNFDHIPELHYRYGYYIMWAVIILTVLSMLYFFRRKRWMWDRYGLQEINQLNNRIFWPSSNRDEYDS